MGRDVSIATALRENERQSEKCESAVSERSNSEALRKGLIVSLSDVL